MAKTKKPRIGRGVRLHPNVVVRHRSPNQSARVAVPLCLITLHDTEGANLPDSIKDLVGLGDFFARPSVQASSHVADDSDGNSARFVSDHAKAWHCAGFNSYSLGIEQIGFASESRVTWRKSWRQLRETARWIAYWSIKYGIPIRRAIVDDNDGTVIRSGVIRHMDLGVIGGGHSDPGPNYPFSRVLLLARVFKAARLARRR